LILDRYLECPYIKIFIRKGIRQVGMRCNIIQGVGRIKRWKWRDRPHGPVNLDGIEIILVEFGAYTDKIQYSSQDISALCITSNSVYCKPCTGNVTEELHIGIFKIKKDCKPSFVRGDVAQPVQVTGTDPCIARRGYIVPPVIPFEIEPVKSYEIGKCIGIGNFYRLTFPVEKNYIVSFPVNIDMTTVIDPKGYHQKTGIPGPG